MNYAIYPVPHWLTSMSWNKKKDWWKDVIIRDQYRCVDCKNGEKTLVVHHIDKSGNSKTPNNSPKNLVSLCRNCHQVRHGNNPKRGRIVEKLQEYLDTKEIKIGILSLIGRELHVSRERVRQIAKINGYLSAHETSKKYRNKACLFCESFFIPAHKTQIFDKDECRDSFHLYKYNTLDVCKECNMGFINPNNRSHKHKYFCSKTCFGKYYSKRYGWGSETNSGRKKYGNVSNDFTEPFTGEEFAREYSYASEQSSRNALKSLIFKGVIEQYKLKGLYRVKNKLPIDF